MRLATLPIGLAVALLVVAWVATLAEPRHGDAGLYVCAGQGTADTPRAITLGRCGPGRADEIGEPRRLANVVESRAEIGTAASVAASPVGSDDATSAGPGSEVEAGSEPSDGAAAPAAAAEQPAAAAPAAAAPAADETIPPTAAPTATSTATPTAVPSPSPTSVSGTTPRPIASPVPTAGPGATTPPESVEATVPEPGAAPGPSPAPAATPGPAQVGPQPFGRPGPWRLIFADEFDVLDTTRWETAWFTSSGFARPVNDLGGACYHPEQVSVVGGVLNLRVDPETDPACLRRDGTRAAYVSGLVNTRRSFTFSYGYAEARIYLPSSGGRLHNWPAFWHTGFDWPTTGEVDIAEGLSDGQPCQVYHYASGGQHLQAKNCVSWDEPGGWHVFAADWRPDRVTYYYDGVEVFSTSAGIVGDPHYLVLNFAVNETSGVVAPSTMVVDYVRVWQQ